MQIDTRRAYAAVPKLLPKQGKGHPFFNHPGCITMAETVKAEFSGKPGSLKPSFRPPMNLGHG